MHVTPNLIWFVGSHVTGKASRGHKLPERSGVDGVIHLLHHAVLIAFLLALKRIAGECRCDTRRKEAVDVLIVLVCLTRQHVVGQEKLADGLHGMAIETREIQMGSVGDRLRELGTAHVTIAAADVTRLQSGLRLCWVKGVDAIRKTVHLIIMDGRECHLSVWETHMEPSFAKLVRIGIAQGFEVVVGGDRIRGRGAIDDRTGFHVALLDRQILQFHLTLFLILFPHLLVFSHRLMRIELTDGTGDTTVIGVAQFDGTGKHLVASQPLRHLGRGVFLGIREHHRRYAESGEEY